jgi:GNAT superfamily N-acetyltransferase
MPDVEYLTAETEEGRRAIAEVANRAIPAALEIVPPEWALVRCVHGEPVAFALIDPQRVMRFGRGAIHYAYVNQIATHADRRSHGHFRATLEEAFRRLKSAGIPLVVLHGAHHLYRRFGFDVFTYHSGIFLTPELIDRSLGSSHPAECSNGLVEACESALFHKDLLYITHAASGSLEEARSALLAAAALAREKNKTRILIEHPDAPSYGSTYPVYATLETPLTTLARTCGARIVVQGANPEESSLPDADWIKVLDPAGLVQAALDAHRTEETPAGPTRLWIDTDAGSFGLAADGAGITLIDRPVTAAETVHWSSSALAQLVTGYRSAEITCAMVGTPLGGDNLALLNALFPPGWRLSQNVSWVTQHRSAPR